MPIRPEHRWLYPIDWKQISAAIRFERAGGRCEVCARPHGAQVRCLPDGRWYDEAQGGWRDAQGFQAPWPDIVDFSQVRETHVVLAACHLDHDPTNNRPENLKSLCQRCHLAHDRPYHDRQRRLTVLLRRAIGDLFHGLYRRW